MSTCQKCGGDIIGDGYKTVMHCEYANESDYEYHEPDANPVLCNFKEPTSEENNQVVIDYVMADYFMMFTDFRGRVYWIRDEPLAAEQLEEYVFELWETGMSWRNIAKHTGRPLAILLGYPEINDLYNK